MDDTNPTKEDTEFVDAIKEDIHWLGFDWGDRFFYGSDYFEKDYRVRRGAHQKGPGLCLRADPRAVQGVPRRPEHPRPLPLTGTAPLRKVLDLFRRMRAGEFPEGKS